MSFIAVAPEMPATVATSSVGAQATHGAFWTILFAGLNKLLAFGSQIALAWYLLPEEMGLVGMVLSITSIVSLVSGTNLKNLLIQRQGAFEENAGDVFWLSLTMNFSAAVLLAAFSPLAGQCFKEPRVVPLLLIMAAAVPLMALPTIYASRLYQDLRFRVLAQIQFGEGLIRNVGSVVLATLGFGAYSLVLPQSASAIYAAACCRGVAGKIPIGRPHPHRWPALLAPAFWLMLLALVTALQSSGTIFVIGLMHTPAVTGFYTWGFALSSQAIFLLGINLQGVFFPVLSKLNDDLKRQNQAFQKACKILILALAPICALQIVLARPVIELLFHQRWLPAVPVVQWLSVGMITQPLSILGTSLLLARGQYRLLASLTAVITILSTAAAMVGAFWGREDEIACCTGISLFFTSCVTGWVACRPSKGSAGCFFRRILPPVLVAFPLILASALLAFATRRCPPLISITVTTTIVLIGYWLGIRFLAPHLTSEFFGRLKLFRQTGSRGGI